MNVYRKYILMNTVILFTFAVLVSGAQDIEEVESERQNQEILRSLDKLKDGANALARNKIEMTTDACYAAIGHWNFCKCLGENLPMSVFFQDYVGLVSMNKSEITEANSGMDSSELQRISQLIDKIREVRNVCVNDNFQ